MSTLKEQERMQFPMPPKHCGLVRMHDRHEWQDEDGDGYTCDGIYRVVRTPKRIQPGSLGRGTGQ